MQAHTRSWHWSLESRVPMRRASVPQGRQCTASIFILHCGKKLAHSRTAGQVSGVASHVAPDHAFRDRSPRQPRRRRARSARLRTDIRLLGRILGDTVRDQEGADVFDLVERIRQTSIRFHRDDDKPARRELEADPRQHVDQPDRAHRARLQLFLASRQHRRGSEQHPADAGADRGRRGAARRACWRRRWRMRATAGFSAADLRRFFDERRRSVRC